MCLAIFFYFDLPTQLKKKSWKTTNKKYGIRCEKIISPVIEVVNFNPMIKVFDMKNFSLYCNIFVQILIQIGTSEMFFYFIDNIMNFEFYRTMRASTTDMFVTGILFLLLGYSIVFSHSKMVSYFSICLSGCLK